MAQEISPRRISIVGPSGSGKTTLAHELGARIGLSVHELDRFRDMNIADAASDEQFFSGVERISGGDQWVIDGHYRCARDLLWQRAEMIVWLNFSLPTVVRNLMKRRKAKNPSPADASANTAVAKAGWRRRANRILKTLREKGEFRRLLSSPSLAHARIVELRSPAEARAWLDTLPHDHR